MDKKAQYEALTDSFPKPAVQPALDRKVARAIETFNATDKEALYKLLYPERQDIIAEISTPSK